MTLAEQEQQEFDELIAAYNLYGQEEEVQQMVWQEQVKGSRSARR